MTQQATRHTQSGSAFSSRFSAERSVPGEQGTQSAWVPLCVTVCPGGHPTARYDARNPVALGIMDEGLNKSDANCTSAAPDGTTMEKGCCKRNAHSQEHHRNASNNDNNDLLTRWTLRTLTTRTTGNNNNNNNNNNKQRQSDIPSSAPCTRQTG